MQIEDCFEIGYISKTHGLKGEVQILFLENPEQFKLQSVFIDYNGKLVPHFVQTYKIAQKNIGYFLFEDIDHIDKAEKIIKRSIFLSNKLKPKKKKSEFTYNDLKGFSVNDVQSGLLGEIADVKEFPKQFIASLMYQNKEILFPLNDDLIQFIDVDKKLLEVNLPDGLLNIYLEA